MSSLATIRAAVRQDLHDEDAAAYRWTDAVLQRHIERALNRYSLFSPLETKNTIAATPGSRDLSIASLTPRVRVVAAEWPTGVYPEEFVPFRVWGDTLTLDVIAPPTAADNVIVWWHKTHSINGSTTFPASHDNIIAGGAAGYASLDRASFATDRLNIGGDEVWGRYADFGQQRLEQFEERLRELPARSRVKSARAYVPTDTPTRTQSTDPGP